MNSIYNDFSERNYNVFYEYLGKYIIHNDIKLYVIYVYQ